MKFKRTRCATLFAKRAQAGFTLAEVLAALAFMAIVLPVAVHALQIASRAGQVAERKGEAARVAERVLNETMIMTNWNRASQGGTIYQGTREYRWQVQTGPWLQEPMRLITAQVNFTVQGRDYDVRLSTLADASP
ncbi:MAG TPA: type II secretion system protein [Verrucomicrobiae bacterium]|jgi:prepilin-type N-terminal cleavage/methylation domain-containing protein